MSDTRKKHSEEAWENGELGATAAYARKAHPKHKKALDESLGLQIISIRLQKDLINDLKNLAAENGLGYQPYIRQLLTQHVRHEKKKA
jgi:predicted DNA binding CopG/RHH family protein